MGLLSWVRGDPHASLKAVIGEHELPSFPAVTVRALELIRDEESSVTEMADLLASDPGLSVRLLRTVNSTAYGTRRTVESVHQAITLLGRSELESLVISMAVGSALPKGPVRGFDPKRFWITASRRAVTARALADCMDPSVRSQCFTAALLQDMAVPVLAHHRGDPYGEILELWHTGSEDLALLERKEHDWDHALVAAWMAAQWGMPKLLTDAIRAHHGTHEGDATVLAPVSLVACLREVNEGSAIEQLASQAASQLQVAEGEALRLIEKSFEAADQGIALVA